jgi:hypothetical protein
MLRFLLKRSPLTRLARGIPLMRVLAAVKIAALVRRHLSKLTPEERRRLARLVGRRRGGSAGLSDAERRELATLLAKLEPRVFAGAAAKQLSPVHLPKRLLYGPRGGAARAAAARRS